MEIRPVLQILIVKREIRLKRKLFQHQSTGVIPLLWVRCWQQLRRQRHTNAHTQTALHLYFWLTVLCFTVTFVLSSNRDDKKRSKWKCVLYSSSHEDWEAASATIWREGKKRLPVEKILRRNSLQCLIVSVHQLKSGDIAVRAPMSPV